MKSLKILILSGALILAAGPSFAENAPKFSLKSLDGKTVNIGALTGKKTVVLNFWASWCSACEEEIPELEGLKTRPGSETALFMGINVRENKSEIRHFITKNKYPYAVLMDSDGRISKLYGLTGVPRTIIINKEGKIVFNGARPPKEYSFR